MRSKEQIESETLSHFNRNCWKVRARPLSLPSYGAAAVVVAAAAVVAAVASVAPWRAAEYCNNQQRYDITYNNYNKI